MIKYIKIIIILLIINKIIKIFIYLILFRDNVLYIQLYNVEKCKII